MDRLIQSADRAIHQAENSGRNRFAIAKDS